MPESKVATSAEVPSHPAAVASVAKFALLVLLVIEKENSLDLPYPSDMEIAPLATPKSPRTAALFMSIWSVAVLPNSTLTSFSDIAPEAGNAILCPYGVP
jgi:hypothetical protein